MNKDEETTWNFNEGRLSCDNKWIRAIDNRIEELEKQVGIPELKRLKKVIKYGWEHEHKEELKERIEKREKGRIKISGSFKKKLTQKTRKEKVK